MRAAIFVLVVCLAFPPAGTRANDPPKGWEFTARTQAAVALDVRARVTGQLARIAVKEGDAVVKGDLLAEIDPTPYRLAQDAATARGKMADARFKAVKIEAANARRLFQQKVISQDELSLHDAKVAEAEARLAVAKAEAEQAKLNLTWTRFTAPFNGRVSRISATEGGVVTTEQTHIMRIVATDPMSVTFNVPEALLLQLRRDGLANPSKLDVAVGFAIDKGYPHAAKLELIALEADPTTNTVQFRAMIANPKGLFSPGMSARVRLTPVAR